MGYNVIKYLILILHKVLVIAKNESYFVTYFVSRGIRFFYRSLKSLERRECCIVAFCGNRI